MVSAGSPLSSTVHFSPSGDAGAPPLAGHFHLLAFIAAALLVLTGLSADHFPPWTSFHVEAPAFAASAVLLVAACRYAPSLRLTTSLCFLVALVGTSWIQLASGLLAYAGDAWVVTAYLLAFAAAWLWGYGAAKTREPHQPVLLVCGVLIVLGALATFEVLAQWLMLGSQFGAWLVQPDSIRPSGNLAQPNQTATLLMMASASGAVLLWRGHIGRRVAWLVFAFFGWAVVLTQSRTAMLSATVMAALLLLLSVRNEKLKAYRMDVFCWIAGMYLAAWVLQNIVSDAFVEGVGVGGMIDKSLRPILWRQLVAGLAEHPWAGYGWLQTASAQQAGAQHVVGIEQAAYSHNVLLDALVFLGVPVGLAVIALALAWLARRTLRLKATGGSAAAGLFLLVPLAVHMNLELPHAYAYFVVPAGMLLGAFDAQTEPVGSRGMHVPGWVVGALACLWIVLLAALAYEYALAEEDYRVNRFENRRVGRTPESYKVPKLHLLTQMGDTLQAMRLRARPGMPPEELATLQRVARRYTWAPLSYRTALACALNGQPEEARYQLRLIKSMFLPTIYEEGRSDWIRVGEEEYPQLRSVSPP